MSRATALLKLLEDLPTNMSLHRVPDYTPGVPDVSPRQPRGRKGDFWLASFYDEYGEGALHKDLVQGTDLVRVLIWCSSRRWHSK